MKYVLDEHELIKQPGQIYNVDESGMPPFALNCGKKGKKKVRHCTSGNKSKNTIVGCVNAVGQALREKEEASQRKSAEKAKKAEMRSNATTRKRHKGKPLSVDDATSPSHDEMTQDSRPESTENKPTTPVLLLLCMI